MSPLYQHVFPPAVAPTLSFIGLPWKVVPFAQYELQVGRCLAWFFAATKKAVLIPSLEHLTIQYKPTQGPNDDLATLLPAVLAAEAIKSSFPAHSLCMQAKWVSRVLSGRAALPSRRAMEADVAAFYAQLKAIGVPQRCVPLDFAAGIWTEMKQHAPIAVIRVDWQTDASA